MFDPRGGIPLTSARLGLVLALIVCALVAPTPARAQSQSAPAMAGYGRVPLAFEANQGQSDATVRFLARGRGYGLFLTPTEAVLALTAPDGGRARGRGQAGGPRDASVPAVIRMRMVDADPHAMVSGLDPLPGRTHYLIGNDPRAWRRNVPTFARVEYRDVYPGIDLVYYGNQRQLEYDFVVRPGADPSRVALDFDGARALSLDADGHLVIATAGGDVTLRRPALYQEVAGVRTPVDGGYIVEGRRVRFRVAAYDANVPLVIDPVLVYSTYLGGVANDEAFGIAVDATANVYVTGSTISPDFPVTLTPFQAAKSLGTDAFVVKIDPTGTNLLYATYLGGSGADAGNAIAVDSTGNAYVAGSTASNDFPTQGAPPQTGRGALSDAFLTKLDAAGSLLVYSMYLGGNADDFAFGVAVDAAGNAYVTGSTVSTDFPTFPASPFDATKGAGTDAFVTKVGPTGALLVYSTYLGGQGEDTGNAIATDTSGNAYVVGTTTSTDFPRQAPMQPARGGAADAFVSKLAPDGLSLVFSTYLGGAQSDEGLGVAVSTDRSVYVTGATASANFPRVGAVQTAIGGLDDAFVARISSSGAALSYSTFLGGAGDDVGNAIAVHSDGTAYVTGSTRSIDFPVVSPIQVARGGGADAFVTKLNAVGNAFLHSTFLGGAGDDEGNAIAVDGDGNAYVAGATNSAAFPTVTPVQGLAGGVDAFVAMVADGGILQFSGTQFTAAETAGTAIVTVQRTGDVTSAVTVNFATADGTANAGADYLAASGTLVFAPGQTSATFTVTILNDGIGDGDETVNLALSTPIGGAVLGGRRTATIRIVDDEPSINFSAPAFTLKEGAAPSATVTVTRSGSTVGTVTVQFATGDGTATTPADYGATTRTLTFAPGVTTQTVLVPVVNDTLAEGTETVNLTLSDVSGGTPAAQLGVRNTAVLTVVDNDVAGVLQFSAATYQANETAPQAVITVSRSGGAASGVTVNYVTSDGSAIAGGDYLTSTGTLTFAAGQNSLTFAVPIINDATPEGEETVSLGLNTPGGGATIGTRGSAVLRIVDDEPTVSFATNAFTVGEGAGMATVTVRRGGVATGTATVDFTTSDSSAVAGVHYTPVSGTLTFGSGVTTRTFTVPILENTTVVANRSLRLTLSNPTGPVTVVDPSQATLTIVDNDLGGALEFSAATFTVAENAGSAIVTVTRSGGTASAVTIDFSTADGTAGGLDYVGNAGTLTFGAGETTKTFTVQLTDDNVAEGVETVNLALSAPGGGGSLGGRSSAVLRIVDDELTFRFSAPVYTVAEGAGVATITVERTGSSAGNVGVEFATSNGTAVAGQDYTAATGTLTFAPGVTTRTFTVPVLQDTLADGAETFNVTLSNPFPPAAQVVAAQGSAVVNITDDDTGGTVQFASATFTGAEGTPTAVVTVRRTLGGASGVTVDYATSNGTATAGLDYTAASGTLTFAAGQSSLTFTVPVLDDAVGEGTETVNLTLSNPAGGAVLGATAGAVLSLTDDEAYVRFSAAANAVSEGAGNAVITVQRGGDPNLTVTVDFATADVLPPGNGKAVAGVDYTATSGTLTFAPGVLTRTFPVPILSDSLVEGEETVELRLSNATVSAGTVTIVTPATAVLTINENDVGGLIQFSAATYTVNETAGEAVITLVRSGGTAEASVQFETGFVPPAPGVPETASAGADYTTTTGTLTFGQGQTTKTVIIPIVNDGGAEGTETINVRVFNPGPSGAPGSPALGPQATAVVKIVDDEQAVQFTAATFTVLEGLPVATITVERAGTAGTVTVDFATSDPAPGPGSGRAGVDYQATAGTLTFGPGVNVGFFSIPLIDNTLVEPPKAVNLTLSNAVGGTLAPQSTAVLTIKENDRGGTFNITGGSIVENQSVFTVTVSRTNGTASAVTVDYVADECASFSAGILIEPCDFSASAGAHFQPVSGTLTFNAGEMSKTFTVNVIDNNFAEGSRNVGLALGNPQPAGIMQDNVDVGAVLGAAQALLNIVEDELHFVNLSAETYSAGEGVGAATITVVRSGLATLLGSSFTVDVEATPLSAIPGQDFSPVTASLVFGPNVTTRTFTVPILEDTIVDGERIVLIAITGVTPLNTAGGPGRTHPQFAQLKITDNDVAGALQFLASTFTVNEDVASGLATITVSRTGGVASEVTVDYETVAPPAPALPEMASEGIDYAVTTGTLTFGAGETTRTFTIPITDDATGEGVESVNLRLLNPSLLNGPLTGPAPTLGTQVTAVLRIVDDEQTVHFARSNYDVNEAAGVVTVLVERTVTAAPLTVDFSTSDDTALAGSEYTAVTGTLSFGIGQAAATFTVPILDNVTLTADRMFNVHLAAPSAGSLPAGRDTATVTLKDDDVGGQVAVGSTSFSVLENAGTATITVTRINGNAGGVTIDYATSDASPAGGAATAGSDYTTTSGTLTFGAGEFVRTFTVPILNDATGESREELTITLSNPQPGLLGPRSPTLGTASAKLSILDDEADFRLGATTYTVSEGAVLASVTVLRGGSLAGTSTVDVTASDQLPAGPGRAVAGQDYAGGTPVTLTFTPGVASMTFDVVITNDTVVEPDEALDITLGNPTSATLGTPASAVLTILDNDVGGTLQFSAPVFTVSETGGTATITVTRVGGAASGVTVDYTTVDGTATTGGGDYTATSGTLTFGAGETSKTFTVPITDDAAGEGAETANVFLTAATGGGAIGEPSVAVLRITDDDNSVQFASATYEVGEHVGVATITVERTGAAGTMTVNYATADGSATAPGDYAAAAGTLTFAPGVFTRTFSVPIVNDNTLEGPETISLTLSGATGGALVLNAATLVVQDNDFGGVIEFSGPTYTVDEDAGVATITLVRLAGTAGGVTVDYATSDNTATGGGVDYATQAGTLTFNPGETSKTFTVPIVNDTTSEVLEVVNLAISNPQPVGVTGSPVLGLRQTAVLEIADNEPALTFLAPEFRTQESAGAATITVVRGGDPTVQVTVDYTTVDGTATVAGGDYATAAGTLTFAPGVISRTFTVTLGNDAVQEAVEETVTLQLANGQPAGQVAVGPTAVLRIRDDDVAGRIEFNASNYSVNEAAGTARITVARTGGTAGPVTIDYATADGTATVADGDYTAISGTLTFNAGETAKTFDVLITDDVGAEGEETVVLSLTNPQGGASLGTPTQATLRIVDDEPTFRFSAPNYTVAENGASVTVTVQRLGSTAGTATVEYATSDGTATGGAVTAPNVDYLTRGGLLTFGPGVASRTFTVPIVNDTAVEGNETVDLTLSNPIGATIVSAGAGTAQITIVNDDFRGSVQFTSATYTVLESTANAAITLTRTGGLGGPVTVQFETVDGTGTAIAGADYGATQRTVTFAANQTTATVMVPIVNDVLDEPGETIVLRLTPDLSPLAPAVAADIGARDTATVTITDSDVAGVLQFSAAVYTIGENAPAPRQLTVTVTRTGGAAGGVTVDYATADGPAPTGATAGVDYIAAAGTLTFNANQTTATFTIDLGPDDAAVEGIEKIILTLSNVHGGATLGARSSAVARIVDDEATVQLSAVSYSVLEGSSLTVTVERTGSVNPVTVNFATSDGSAVGGAAAGPGVDYLTRSGTLTFTTGVMTRTFTVPTVTNVSETGNRTLSITLSGATGAALGPAAAAVVTIVENDEAGVIQLSAPAYSVSEHGLLATIVVNRTGGAAAPVTVQYATSDGTATSGIDYTARAGTLSFAAGQTLASFTVPILPDTVEEGARSFNVTLTNPTGGAVLGPSTTAIVNIVDDDEGGVIQFSQLTFNASECASLPCNALVTIIRKGGTAGGVTVDLTTSDGTATAGVDYLPTTTTVVLANGQLGKVVPIPLLIEPGAEPLKTFNVTLSNPRGGAAVGVIITTVVRITDSR